MNTATQIQDQTSKNFPWTNALAYFAAVSVTEKKVFGRMKKNLVVGKQKNGAATIHRVCFGRMPVNQMIHIFIIYIFVKLCILYHHFAEYTFYQIQFYQILFYSNVYHITFF